MSDTAYEPSGIMGQQIFGLPVDRKTLFSNHKKIYKKRIEKRQRKLIIKLPFLKPFLKRGEQILLITTGYSPLGSLAQYVTGFVFVYLKRSLFVFTNHRILHVPTTPSYKYKGAVSQIPYSGCQSIALKGGTLVAEYGNFGKVETFKGIPVAERKKIRALLEKVPKSGTKGDTAGLDRRQRGLRDATGVRGQRTQMSRPQAGARRASWTWAARWARCLKAFGIIRIGRWSASSSRPPPPRPERSSTA